MPSNDGTLTEAHIHSGMTPGQIAEEVIRVVAGPGYFDGVVDGRAGVIGWLLRSYSKAAPETEDAARERLEFLAEFAGYVSDLSRISAGTRDDVLEHLGWFAAIASPAVRQLGKMQLAARDQWGFGLRGPSLTPLASRVLRSAARSRPHGAITPLPAYGSTRTASTRARPRKRPRRFARPPRRTTPTERSGRSRNRAGCRTTWTELGTALPPHAVDAALLAHRGEGRRLPRSRRRSWWGGGTGARSGRPRVRVDLRDRRCPARVKIWTWKGFSIVSIRERDMPRFLPGGTTDEIQ